MDTPPHHKHIQTQFLLVIHLSLHRYFLVPSSTYNWDFRSPKNTINSLIFNIIFNSRCSHSDDRSLLHSPVKEIINMTDLRRALPPLHAQRNLLNSSSWVDWFRISDRKFVNHTTEMILWSMILISYVWPGCSMKIDKDLPLKLI